MNPHQWRLTIDSCWMGASPIINWYQLIIGGHHWWWSTFDMLWRYFQLQAATSHHPPRASQLMVSAPSQQGVCHVMPCSNPQKLMSQMGLAAHLDLGWNSLVGGWATPLKNMSSSIGMMKFPIYGTIKHVPNHQPVVSRMGDRYIIGSCCLPLSLKLWGMSAHVPTKSLYSVTICGRCQEIQKTISLALAPHWTFFVPLNYPFQSSLGWVNSYMIIWIATWIINIGGWNIPLLLKSHKSPSFPGTSLARKVGGIVLVPGKRVNYNFMFSNG